MGTWGSKNNELLYSWFEALYMGILELYIPYQGGDRIKMNLPYCMVCGDPNIPALFIVILQCNMI